MVDGDDTYDARLAPKMVQDNSYDILWVCVLWIKMLILRAI